MSLIPLYHGFINQTYQANPFRTEKKNAFCNQTYSHLPAFTHLTHLFRSRTTDRPRAPALPPLVVSSSSASRSLSSTSQSWVTARRCHAWTDCGSLARTCGRTCVYTARSGTWAFCHTRDAGGASGSRCACIHGRTDRRRSSACTQRDARVACEARGPVARLSPTPSAAPPSGSRCLEKKKNTGMRVG